MDRLQKKCFVASAGLHLLLLLVILFGPAFLAGKKKEALPVINFIPAKLVDQLMYGGGSPQAAPPPPAASPTPPEPAPPKPEPVKPVKAADPAPAPTKEVKRPEKKAVDLEKTKTAKTPPEKTAPKRDLGLDKLVTRKPDDSSAQQAAATKAATKAATDAKQRAAVGKSVQSLEQGLSKVMTIEVPGPGGATYANYAQWVRSVYDHAWIDPQDVSDESATVQVKVTIQRDGTVLSATIIKSSGLAALDKSVRAALDRVTSIGQSFPEGAKEEHRTFTLNFNLKGKRSPG